MCSLSYGGTADKGLEVMRFSGFIPAVQIHCLHRLTLNNSITTAQIIWWEWVELVWKETEREQVAKKKSHSKFWA